jgi:hypothetical protein
MRTSTNPFVQVTVTITGTGATRTAIITGLTADTPYDFEVFAIKDGVKSTAATLSGIATLAKSPVPPVGGGTEDKPLVATDPAFKKGPTNQGITKPKATSAKNMANKANGLNTIEVVWTNAAKAKFQLAEKGNFMWITVLSSNISIVGVYSADLDAADSEEGFSDGNISVKGNNGTYTISISGLASGTYTLLMQAGTTTDGANVATKANGVSVKASTAAFGAPAKGTKAVSDNGGITISWKQGTKNQPSATTVIGYQIGLLVGKVYIFSQADIDAMPEKGKDTKASDKLIATKIAAQATWDSFTRDAGWDSAAGKIVTETSYKIEGLASKKYTFGVRTVTNLGTTEAPNLAYSAVYKITAQPSAYTKAVKIVSATLGGFNWTKGTGSRTAGTDQRIEYEAGVLVNKVWYWGAEAEALLDRTFDYSTEGVVTLSSPLTVGSLSKLPGITIKNYTFGFREVIVNTTDSLVVAKSAFAKSKAVK